MGPDRPEWLFMLGVVSKSYDDSETSSSMVDSKEFTYLDCPPSGMQSNILREKFRLHTINENNAWRGQIIQSLECRNIEDLVGSAALT